MSGVKQYSITELASVSQPSSKLLELSISTLSAPLVFHCGSSDVATAIIAKLESSKAAAGEALEMAAAETNGASDAEDGYAAPAAAEPKTVRWAAEPTSPAGGTKTATVLYDFDAQGEDELTVGENEVVTVVDKENDEWWSVRNSAGAEGVVPAQYVQMNDGSETAPATSAYDPMEEERKAREEAEASAALEAERQRDAQSKVEQRRAIEKAARERQKQEEADRDYALEVEAKEAAKAERRARRAEAEQRTHREREAAKR